jgi:hypothetical protein
MQNNELSRQIEAYFALLEAPLQELPVARRDEFVAEARAHLHAMVEARRADGLDEAAAWNAALNDFGEPGVVGRALWKAWASSAQLESEGVPLTKRELIKRYRWHLVAGFCVCGLLALLRSLDPPWGRPFVIGFGVLCFVFGTYRSLRVGMRWTPSNIASFVLCIFALLLSSVQLVWGASFGATFLFTWANSFLLALGLLWLYLYKRDLLKRPWKSSVRFKQSPVAAEQEYRLAPAVGLVMGLLFVSAVPILTGLQTFGLIPAILGWVGFLGGAFVLGRWLK